MISSMICQWLRHSWKSLANRLTSDQKALFMVRNTLLSFLDAILCPEHTISLKQSSMAHLTIATNDRVFWLSIVTSLQLICDVTQTRGTGIVQSYSSIILALTLTPKRSIVTIQQIILIKYQDFKRIYHRWPIGVVHWHWFSDLDLQKDCWWETKERSLKEWLIIRMMLTFDWVMDMFLHYDDGL